MVPAVSAKRIAIVDDHSPVLRALVRVLRVFSAATIETFRSGDDAIRRHREAPFDLALMDVTVPGRDGVSTGLALRETTPSLPLIFLTGDPTGPDAARASLFASAVLDKPWDSKQLVGLIAAQLERG